MNQEQRLAAALRDRIRVVVRHGPMNLRFEERPDIARAHEISDAERLLEHIHPGG